MSAGFETVEEFAATLEGLFTELQEACEEDAESIGECAEALREAMGDQRVAAVSFDRAGIFSNNAGFVLRVGGREFCITVVER